MFSFPRHRPLLALTCVLFPLAAYAGPTKISHAISGTTAKETHVSHDEKVTTKTAAKTDTGAKTLEKKIVTGSKIEPKVVTSHTVTKAVATEKIKTTVGSGAPLILTRPADKIVTSSVGLKLPKDAKVHADDLARIRPIIDLTKVKADKVLAAKPPADFKVKSIALDKIHLPSSAPVVANLNAKVAFSGEKYIVNKYAYTGSDYHLRFGVRTSYGWIYSGINHHHWHHSIWDPNFGCYYYYDPCQSCYYYWNAGENCYYPCWWFVSYSDCYYPWWLCGGCTNYGYNCGSFGIHVRIGW